MIGAYILSSVCSMIVCIIQLARCLKISGKKISILVSTYRSLQYFGKIKCEFCYFCFDFLILIVQIWSRNTEKATSMDSQGQTTSLQRLQNVEKVIIFSSNTIWVTQLSFHTWFFLENCLIFAWFMCLYRELWRFWSLQEEWWTSLQAQLVLEKILSKITVLNSCN